MISALFAANPVEGFLRRRLLGSLFAAWLGLLVPFCVGQDPVPPAPVPQNQPAQKPAARSQASPEQASPNQSQQGQAPSENDSSSKSTDDQPPASLPKEP